jgi:outer membrane protein OmpA-like peptidoglycan-associated protein
MRIAPLLPLLLPTFALPAVAGDYSMCLTAAQSVSCLIEQAEFEYARNVEINASIARVERVRAFEAARNAEIAASIARVEARRQRQLERAQNALINASIAAANMERERRFAAAQNALATASVERVGAVRKQQLALSKTHCKTRFSRTPRCLAERQQRFARHQNALATLSIERVRAERERAFAAARNAEISASIAAVARNRAAQQFAASSTSHCEQNASSPRCAAERAREMQASLTHCKSAEDASPRCMVERDREFHLARNAEINASIAAVARNRAAQQLANAASTVFSQIETATVCQPYNCNPNDYGQRAWTPGAEEYAALTSHCVRAPQSPRCEAERIREFAAARNAEINASIAAVERARAAEATGSTITRDNGTGPDAESPTYGGNRALETGAIGVREPLSPGASERNDLRNNISIEPCRRSGTPFGPLHFIQGAEIEEGMKPELDRLVSLAQACPGMRIEVHGYSDGTGSAFTNRSMAQARAQAIANYLIAAGVAPNRLAAIGRGAATDWVAPYGKGMDRSSGRRVEFIIKDPAMDAAARRVMYDLAELLDPTYVPAVADLSP